MNSLCVRCANALSTGQCCSAHNKRLCHLCYRLTHWVEVCTADCPACAAENLPVKLRNWAVPR
ncbi:hypothetical protein [Micromonospora sp. NPDC005299]|uniref:hypothetical protein n=1 Tax=Micromonospora sp. NPDC005299 TaxID=3364231 RepID=UPI0036919D49